MNLLIKMEENSWMFKIRSFTQECIRVLKITKRPDRAEFGIIVKMSALGMAIVGLLGFAISMGKILIFQ